MRFGVSGDRDTEFGKLAMDQSHKLVRLTKATGHGLERCIALGRVATEGDDILNIQFMCRSEVVAKLVDRAANAREMGGNRQLKLAADTSDNFECEFLGRAAGAVRACDKARPEFDKMGNVLE
jgi:hypothetical protein